MVTIYGIKNCSTMKKAFDWLQIHEKEFRFHDYRKDGVPRDRLVAWCQVLGWKTLLNSRGPTFRQLPADRQQIETQSQAIALMLEFPAIIKRPVVESVDGHFLVGFDPALFSSFIK